MANAHTVKPIIREMESENDFRVRAKIALVQSDMTIRDLAEALGTHRNTISQAINYGIHQPTRRRIAALLGIAA